MQCGVISDQHQRQPGPVAKWLVSSLKVTCTRMELRRLRAASQLVRWKSHDVNTAVENANSLLLPTKPASPSPCKWRSPSGVFSPWLRVARSRQALLSSEEGCGQKRLSGEVLGVRQPQADLQSLADGAEEHQQAGQPHEPGRNGEAEIGCIELAQAGVGRSCLSPPVGIVVAACTAIKISALRAPVSS